MLRTSLQPASPFKSSSASADTAFSIKLYSSDVFRIVQPQGLLTRSDKVWFRDKESPIDPQHSAKISPALEGENKFLKGTLAPSEARSAKSAVVSNVSYLGPSTSFPVPNCIKIRKIKGDFLQLLSAFR